MQVWTLNSDSDSDTLGMMGSAKQEAAPWPRTKNAGGRTSSEAEFMAWANSIAHLPACLPLFGLLAFSLRARAEEKVVKVRKDGLCVHLSMLHV